MLESAWVSPGDCGRGERRGPGLCRVAAAAFLGRRHRRHRRRRTRGCANIAVHHQNVLFLAHGASYPVRPAGIRPRIVPPRSAMHFASCVPTDQPRPSTYVLSAAFAPQTCIFRVRASSSRPPSASSAAPIPGSIHRVCMRELSVIPDVRRIYSQNEDVRCTSRTSTGAIRAVRRISRRMYPSSTRMYSAPGHAACRLLTEDSIAAHNRPMTRPHPTLSKFSQRAYILL